MQTAAKLRSIRKLKDTKGLTCRHCFNFGTDKEDQLVVEISYHHGLKTWTAEAYYYGTDFDECRWAQVFAPKRKALISKLRMAVAIKKDPDLEKVNDAMLPRHGRSVSRWAEGIDRIQKIANRIGKPING